MIDRSQDSLGREIGWQLKDGSTVENRAIYAYGANDGRHASVGNGVETFAYGYLADSSLIATVTSPAHTVTNTYEATRDVLASKENEVGSTLISGYSYTVNAIGQRTNVAKTGTAFSSARDIAWGYDALGQVTSADSTIPGLDRGYRYDTIGNRLKSVDGTTDPDDPSATVYTANALNQYSQISNNPITNNPSNDADCQANTVTVHNRREAISCYILNRLA